MKTMLLVKLAFLPVIVFGVFTAAGYRLLALDLATAVSAALVAWNLRKGLSRPMETALLIAFALPMLATHLGHDMTDHAVWLTLAGQGVAGLVTALNGRAWTSDYSGAQYAEVRETPAFRAINQVLSNIWTALFFLLALLAYAHVEGWWSGLITTFGIVLSIVGPKLAIRWKIRQILRKREAWTWPDATFGTRNETKDVDVAIIGAGLGGLTAGALLAEAGLKVLIAEQHVEPGGFCHHWVRKVRHDGNPLVFRFDAGIHDFSGVHPGGPVAGVLDRLGIQLDWQRLHHTALIDGKPLVVAEGWHDYAAQLGRLFPVSAAGLMCFFEEMKAIHDGLYSTGAGRCGVPGMPETVEAMLAFPKQHPLAARWMERPFAEFVTHHVTDTAAQKALYGLCGYITDRPEELTVLQMAPIFGYHFNGGYYPKGGSGVLSGALVDAIRRRGGEVLLKAPVDAILVENGRACGIRLASGREIRARAVISNADLKRTFTRLVPEGALPADITARFAAAEPATSAFMVHLGLDVQPDITDIASAQGADGLAVGLVTTTRADPSAAPQGYGTLELIALIPNEEARTWLSSPEIVDDKRHRQSEDYAARKTAFGDRMIAAAETLIPDLRDHIILRADASPLTFARYDWASDGAIYGLAMKDRFRGVKSPLPGLYLAGAGNFGPGAEAAIIVGAQLAERLAPGILVTQADREWPVPNAAPATPAPAAPWIAGTPG